MTALVIKNLPDDVLVRLKERAKANHRSLTKEVIVLLTSGVVPPAPRARAPLPPACVLPSGPLSLEDIEDAIDARTGEPLQAADGMAALRAALVEQADGSYVNLLGIEDEGFFETLDKMRGEFGLPDPIDFGVGKP